MPNTTQKPQHRVGRDARKFSAQYGPWALITGASSGIGAEFAEQLAAAGINLAITARSRDVLLRQAERLRRSYGIEAQVITADLATEAGLSTVIKETSELDIGLLVNNAGREDSGPFLGLPIEDALVTLDLNARAPLRLAHHFALKMKRRGSGGIVFLSSIVAFQGVRYVANYAATKAYDLVLAESLAAELEPDGIDVLAVAPGFTRSNLSPAADFRGVPITPMSPKKVVRQALKKLGRTRLVVPGAVNKFLFFSSKYLQPRRLNTFAFSQVFARVLRNKLVAAGTSSPLITRNQ